MPTNPVTISGPIDVNLLNDTNADGTYVERCYRIPQVSGPGANVALLVSSITNGANATPVVNLYVKNATMQSIDPNAFDVSVPSTYSIVNRVIDYQDTSSSLPVGNPLKDNGLCQIVPPGSGAALHSGGVSPVAKNKANTLSGGVGDGLNCTIPWHAFTSVSNPPRTTQDIALVTGVGGRTNRVVKFEARKFDQWNTENYPRSELALPFVSNSQPSTGFFFEYGKNYYIKTSYFLPTDYVVDVLQDELSFQVHHPCGGQPQLSRIFTKFFGDAVKGGSNWKVRTSPTPWGMTCSLPSDINEKNFSVWDLASSRGRWIDIEVDYKPAYDNTGRLIVKEEGCTVISLINAPNSYDTVFPAGGAQSGPAAGRLQLGIYKWDWNTAASTLDTAGPGGTPVPRILYYGPTMIAVKP